MGQKVNNKEKVKYTNNKVIIKSISSDIKLDSKALDEDEFNSFYADGSILEPLYNPELLTRLPEYSDILLQCIDAYKTNIVGFGYNFMYDVDYDKSSSEKKEQLDAEWSKYEYFFKYCNYEEEFITLMKKVIDDRERIGYGVLEVIENSKGEPAGFEHIPAHKIRMCRKEIEAIPVNMLTLNAKNELIEITVMKKFRKYVQLINGQKVFFKEFGDNRIMNCKTGIYDENTPIEDRATSIIMIKIYCPYTSYGLPRYIGQLLNIQGNRKAEELNYTYFSEGRHLPMAIIVENGKLTENSMEEISNSKGDLARHKYIVIEAEGLEKDVTIGDDNGKSNVKIRIEKLADILEKDGLFQEYCEKNRNKIRSAFRLHPIYTGESQDYTRATADTARQITEEQVFQPERKEIEYIFNNILRKYLNIKEVSMRFAAPIISDKTQLAQAIKLYSDTGAITPNMIIDAVSDLLGKTFEVFEEEWGNKPIAITLKQMELEKDNSNQTIIKSDNESIINILNELKVSIEEALFNSE